MLKLHPEEQTWLDEYRKALLEQQPGAVTRMLIYGSKARENANEDSDLDVLLIVKNESADLNSPWQKSPRHPTSLHPGGLHCDSVTYSRYALESRLVRRAQERSRCSAGLSPRTVKRPLRRIGYTLAATSWAVPSIMAYTQAEWDRLRVLRSPYRESVEREGVAVL